MQELLKKIEASAAARLSLPPGREPAQELARYKAFLKVETHRLKMLHRAGGGGLEVCHARSVMMDLLLRHLWGTAKANLTEAARKEFPHLALVAIGGYGRGELNPHSDIDFMFLHSGQVAGNRPLPYLSKIIDGILYPLWDIGLKVGHSVRSIEDCVKVANTDMQSKTSLIEARLVVGDEDLFLKFQKALVNKCVEGHVEEYIAMRVADQAARREKFGNSACMQEPNLKNGCGGLRDFQNLLWMAFFKHRTRSLTELQAQGLISEKERKQLEGAYDFLLRARTEMHYHLNRAMDVLTKNLQPTVAHNLGFTERSPSERIERFMRELYMRSRNVFLITRTLEQRLALQPEVPRRLSLRSFLPGGRKPVIEPVDGFKFCDHEIHAVSDRVFREQPCRLMRVFLYAQQRGLRLHPDLAQLIRKELLLVDRTFLMDQHVRETFLTILDQRGNVAPILRTMHEVDFLGRYIPEFRKLTCLVQHEFYHLYAADEHTLVCLEQLDRVWNAKAPPYTEYAELLHKVERPFILYLALLLHDLGKPEGHGHPALSGEMALRVAKRLDLDGAATHTLRVIIENHLLLASISQRRDLDDPSVIRHVAKQIQTPETLGMLTLHTFADSLATSDKLWNGFKDSLLWALHNKTMALMTGGTEFVRTDEMHRELLRQEVNRLLAGSADPAELQAHFTKLPPRYYQLHSAREVIADLVLVNRFLRLQVLEDQNVLGPIVSWQDQPDRGANLVKVCTWDREGLFSKIAGSFSAAGLNILSSRVFTRSDGIALDAFLVTDARNGSLAGPEQRDKFQEVLKKALAGGGVDFPALIARQKITRPLYQAYSGEHISTQVRFEDEASDTRTIIEIETEDRLGLLYIISQTLAELNLDISNAKILTEKGAAIDSFYVRETNGARVSSPERRTAIERRLRRAIQKLAERSGEA
jgi:[protein-PII] uridylyltransferase